MEFLDIGYISWFQYFVYTGLTVLAYLVLKTIINRRLWMELRFINGRNLSFIMKKVSLFLPFTFICVCIALFVMVNPKLHGLLILIFGVFSYVPLKHVFNGLAFLNEKDVGLDQEVVFHDKVGRVEKIGSLGLYLRSTQGLQFINFSKLLEEGLTTKSSNKTNTLMNFELGQREGFDFVHAKALMIKLMFVPFIDNTSKPKVDEDYGENRLLLSLFLTSSDYRIYLIEILEEMGYEVINKSTKS